MRTKLCLVIMVLWTTLLVADQLTVKVEGTRLYNVLRISSFDVSQPQNQPLFFTVTIDNFHDESQRGRLGFNLKWNDDFLINNTYTRYKNEIPAKQVPSIPGTRRFSNRDIFSQTDTGLFYKPEPPITLSDLIDSISDTYRNTILSTGLFPDGSYSLEAWFEYSPDGSPPYTKSNVVTFTFTIRNPGGIFLVGPGSMLGGATTPLVSGSPLNFRWISNLSGGDTKFNFVIKEFEDQTMLNPSFIDIGGDILQQTEVSNTFYSDFLELKDNRFYAWQVATEIRDPNLASTTYSKSPWYVFRYSADPDGSGEENIKNIEFFLMTLNIPELRELLGAGFRPSGIIEFNGRVFSGAEIQSAIMELQNRNIVNVEISD